MRLVWGCCLLLRKCFFFVFSRAGVCCQKYSRDNPLPKVAQTTPQIKPNSVRQSDILDEDGYVDVNHTNMKLPRVTLSTNVSKPRPLHCPTASASTRTPSKLQEASAHIGGSCHVYTTMLPSRPAHVVNQCNSRQPGQTPPSRHTTRHPYINTSILYQRQFIT